jgi:hypothetical protein
MQLARLSDKMLLFAICCMSSLPAVKGAHAVLSHRSSALRAGAWGNALMAEGSAYAANATAKSLLTVASRQPPTATAPVDPDALDYEDLADASSWHKTWGWAFFALSVNFGAFALAATLAHVVPPRPTSYPDFYWRIFKKHQNTQFADDLELAIRGGIGAIFIAIPYMVPDAMFLVRTHRYTSDIALMFIFTIYKTVGQTAENAFNGMCGTFLACFNIWIMFGIFPDGVTETSGSLVWWFGLIEAVTYIVLIVGLHLDTNLKMFALNWHCYFMMSFLDPTPVAFSTGFSLRLTGPAVSAFLMSSIGAGMAIICTLLPFPLFALDKARTSATSLCDSISKTWNIAADAITSTDGGTKSLDELVYAVGGMHGEAATMSGYITSAWWECLGLGRPQRVRDVLISSSEPLILLYDRLCGVRNILASSSEPLDQEYLSALKPQIKKLTEAAGNLLASLVAACEDGYLSDEDKEEIAKLRTEVKEGMTEFSTAFRSRMPQGPIDSLVRESALCLMICSYGSIVTDCGEHMLAKMEGAVITEKPKFADVKSKLVGVKLWDDPIYRNCFIRSCVAILVCFGAGYNGYSAIFPGYNAYPAATVSLLLSSGLTAQISKNMVRFEGVLFGVTLGQIFYAVLAWCSISGYIFTGVFCFTWSACTLFLYFNSPSAEYSLLGCLISAFGLGGYLKGCSNEVFLTTSSYGTVVSLVFLICVKLLVDASLARNSASAESATALCAAWQSYREAFTDFCDAKNTTVLFRAEYIKGMFSDAVALGSEASKEPRGVKTPWKGDLFQSVCSSGQRICESLSNMEASFSQTGRDGGEKSNTLQEMIKTQAFMNVKDDIDNQLQAIEDICSNAFLHTTQGRFASVYKPVLSRRSRESITSDMKGLHAALLQAGSESHAAGKVSHMQTHALDEASNPDDNLENSMRCKLSVTMFTLTRQLDILAGIERSILCNA